MSEIASGINHNILKWARLKAGYTIEDIADKFNIPPWMVHMVSAWKARLWLAKGHLQ